MWRGLSDGHWPVRWSENFGYGYGIPLFEFYAPLPYLFGALLFGLGLPSVLIIKLLFLIPNIVATWGSYRLGKKLFNTELGVILALLFVLAPYRALNLFVRGAISESWAMMVLPTILLGTVLTLEKEKHGKWWLLASLLVLFLSHNISTLLFLPFSLFFAVGYWLLIKKGRGSLIVLAELAGTYLVSISLAAFYLIPAVLEKKFVQIQTLTSDYYQYTNHFLYLRQFLQPFWGYGGSAWGPDDGLSFFLGYGFWLATIIAGLVGLWFILQKLQKRVGYLDKPLLLLFLFALATVGAFLMTTEKTAVIWNSFSTLHFAQFPWRYLSVATFFASITITAAFFVFLKTQLRLLVLGILLVVCVIGNAGYFQPDYWLESPSEFYFSDEERIAKELGPTLVEYLPTQLATTTPRGVEIMQITADVASGDQTVFETKVDKVQYKEIEMTIATPTSVVWQTAAYPGWTMALDQEVVETQITPEGLLTQTVPPGKHTLSLRWQSTTVRAISDTITVLGSVVLLCLHILPRASKAFFKQGTFPHER